MQRDDRSPGADFDFDFFGGGDGHGEDVGFGAGAMARSSRRPWRRRLIGGGVALAGLLGAGVVLSPGDDGPAVVPPTSEAPGTTSTVAVAEDSTVTHALTVGAVGLAPADFPWVVYLRSEDGTRGYRLALDPMAFVPLDQVPMGVLAVGDTTVVLDANDLGALTTYLGPDGAVWTSWSNLYLRLSFGAGGLRGVVEEVAPLDLFGVDGLAPLAGTSSEGRPVIVAPDGAVFAVQSDEALAAVEGASGMENGVYTTLACDETGGCFSQIETAGARPAQVPGLVTRIDVAPDGTRVACWIDGAVYLANLANSTAELLDDAGPQPPSDEVHGGIGWSPDSRWYAYAATGGEVRIVDTDNSSARLAIGIDENLAVAGLG